MNVFIPRFSSCSAFTSLPPGQDGGRDGGGMEEGGRDGGGREGAFDAAAGAALLSVVDLPDLSTVNRQG